MVRITVVLSKIKFISLLMLHRNDERAKVPSLWQVKVSQFNNSLESGNNIGCLKVLIVNLYLLRVRVVQCYAISQLKVNIWQSEDEKIFSTIDVFSEHFTRSEEYVYEFSLKIKRQHLFGNLNKFLAVLGIGYILT